MYARFRLDTLSMISNLSFDSKVRITSFPSLQYPAALPSCGAALLMDGDSTHVESGKSRQATFIACGLVVVPGFVKIARVFVDLIQSVVHSVVGLPGVTIPQFGRKGTDGLVQERFASASYTAYKHVQWFQV